MSHHHRDNSQQLGDFTTTARVIRNFPPGGRHRYRQYICGVGTTSTYRALHEFVLFRTGQHSDGVSGRETILAGSPYWSP